MGLEPGDESPIADDGDHRRVGSVLVMHVMLLGDVLASRLDELLGLRIEEVVIDVYYRSVIHDSSLLGDPATGSPFFIQTVSP